MTFKRCHLGITPQCRPPPAFWELGYSAGFACTLHYCECIWCGRRTRVNPSLSALLNPSAHCLLLNHVFPWADLYLHLRGKLIVQICKQSPNNSTEETPLLWESSSRKHREVWRVFLSLGSGPFECYWSETPSPRWGPPPRGGFQNYRCYCSAAKLCPALCKPMDWSTPGFPVLHYLLEFAQTHVSESHPTISSSAAPFPFCLQPFPASESFPMSWLFTSGGQSIRASASASVLLVNIQGWFPLGLTGLISLLSKGLSRVFSSTTIRKHQFSGAQPFLMVQLSHPYIITESNTKQCIHIISINREHVWYDPKHYSY